MTDGVEIDWSSWRELSPLLDEALELPFHDRDGWLANLGPQHDALKPRLVNLLSARQTGQQFISTMPKLEAGSAQLPADLPGAYIGPYRLVRLLAEGGMGLVWLAERDDWMIHRPVALKLPHGNWQRDSLADRLEREREILATLNHPNIARLYDAGLTDDGRPYLVLEYVEGCHIDAYCDKHSLDLPARLRLFLQVMNGLGTAHAQLVIHRDLKPSNILVSAGGAVKLLDFGIAKLIEQAETRDSRLTRLSGRPLTPDYASPEQVAGAPIGIASDVYSLGVLLYKLVTGAQPYRLKRDSNGALEDAILDAQSPLPSKVADNPQFRKKIRGDLDTIVLHALKKQPEQRYPTVHAFADDIERFLEGRPILARPDSFRYRLSKFIGRNRLAVCASVMALLVVLAGASIAIWQARTAFVERRRAEDVKDFLVSTFQETDPYAGSGRVLSAIELLKQAREKADSTLGDRPDLKIELLNILGWSLLSLQDTAAAETVINEAVDEATVRLGNEHLQTLRARVLRTIVYRYRGRNRDMRQELDRLLPALWKNQNAAPQDLIRALRNNANLLMHEGAYDSAESAAKQAVQLSLSRYGEKHGETFTSLLVLGLAHLYAKQQQLALEIATRAFHLGLELSHGNPRHPRAIEARDLYGRALAQNAQPRRAIEQLDQALNLASQFYGPSALSVGYISQHLALCQLDVGEIKKAIENARKACAVVSRNANANSFIYASQVNVRGMALLEARRSVEAVTDLDTALEVFQRTLGPDHAITRSARVNRALALAYAGRAREAEQVLETLTGRPSSAADDKTSYARGVVARLAGNPVEALRMQRAVLVSLGNNPKAPVLRARALTEAGFDQLVLGNTIDAASHFEQARALFSTLEQRMSPAHAEALVGLARAKMRRGDTEGALFLLRKAHAFWNEFDPHTSSAAEAASWLRLCKVRG